MFHGPSILLGVTADDIRRMSDADKIEFARLLDQFDAQSARDDFLTYYERMTGFIAPKHLQKLCLVLQALEENKIDRVMVFMPPRHAKTLVGNKLFMSWVMGRNPTESILSAAHTQNLAKKIGNSVRNYIKHPLSPFEGLEVSKTTDAKDAFLLTAGGEYNAFGMSGGAAHGNPADWLTMDDIVKGREIANSPHRLEEVFEVYQTDLLSRRQGRAKQLMIFTRWHENDPAGRILPENYNGETGWFTDRITGERWYVFSLPAIAEHDNDPLGRKKGEWLWPSARGEGLLGPIFRRGGRTWSALYQQRPSPLEGVMFKEEHFKYYEPGQIRVKNGRATLRHVNGSAEELTVYGSSDYAVTAEDGKNSPDYTWHLVWGVDSRENVYLLDGWYGRTTPDVWIVELVRLMKKWKPIGWAEERGQIISAVGPLIKRILARDRIYVDRQQVTSSTNKINRAQTLLGLMNLGQVFFPRGAGFAERLIAEMLQFPTGKNDDGVDTATLFARFIDRVLTGKPKPSAAAPDDYDAVIDDVLTELNNEPDQE